MMTFTELASVPPGPLTPFTDRLRLAVAAYLTRFKGSSREHTESDLRCYLAWCAERGLDPLSAQRAHLELYIRSMQEIRRFKPSTVSRRFSVAAGFYRTCVLDGVLEHSPAEHVRRPSVPAESPTLGFAPGSGPDTRRISAALAKREAGADPAQVRGPLMQSSRATCSSCPRFGHHTGTTTRCAAAGQQSHRLGSGTGSRIGAATRQRVRAGRTKGKPSRQQLPVEDVCCLAGAELAWPARGQGGQWVWESCDSSTAGQAFRYAWIARPVRLRPHGSRTGHGCGHGSTRCRTLIGAGRRAAPCGT